MRKLQAALVLVAILLSGCEDDSVTDSNDEGVSGTAYVRFIHAAAAAGNLDFYVQDYTADYFYPVVSNVSYGEEYGYYAFTSGMREFRAYYSGTDIAIADVEGYASADVRYTILACNTETAVHSHLLTITDTGANPPADSVYVRIAQLAPGMPVCNAYYSDSTLLVDSLDVYEVSDYRTLPEGKYVFNAKDYDTGAEIVIFDTLTFVTGNNYTVVWSGAEGGSPGNTLNARAYNESE